MEKFDVKKHWEDFKNSKVVVNCKTKEESFEFLDYCHNNGIQWASNSSIKDTNLNSWNSYEEKTCYRCVKGMDKLMYAYISYYKSENKYTILEYNGILSIGQIPQVPTGTLAKIITNSNIKPTTTNKKKEKIEVVYNGNQTIVVIKDYESKKYFKGIAECSPEDTYNPEEGFKWAYLRAREKQNGKSSELEETIELSKLTSQLARLQKNHKSLKERAKIFRSQTNQKIKKLEKKINKGIKCLQEDKH